ncbi:hypothetical protein [Desulfovibrio sp. JC010]|uniref:hypothetical protein n=1 Tax=Desulfovibrio sp. JC010 TaxID=2593641 RepID=UPI0013D11536|nr:hypothetical protein [Desulfovibrio sp. JC010]NDV26938.1 hypothetical protein [Desulfovibrio sp. JC010]
MDLMMLAERENTLLGQDFLTWLWYKSEIQDGMFELENGDRFMLYMEQRMSVQGGDGENVDTATVNSASGDMTEVLYGLRTGKKVTRCQLKMEIDENLWQVQLKAEDFTMSGLKTPKVDMKDEEGDDPDAKFLEKIYLIEKCIAMFDHVFKEFITIRISDQWKDEVARFQSWLREGEK